MLLEIPAGVLEEGEEPGEGIKRELAEETGNLAGNMEFICELYPTVGYCTEKIFLYFASDLTPCPCCFDEDEFIEVERYTPEEDVYKRQALFCNFFDDLGLYQEDFFVQRQTIGIYGRC